MSNGKNLDGKMKRLKEISEWFENQEEVDIEEGLENIKEAAILIKESRKRLKQIENEFEQIKKDIDEEVVEDKVFSSQMDTPQTEKEIREYSTADKKNKVEEDNIPF